MRAGLLAASLFGGGLAWGQAAAASEAESPPTEPDLTGLAALTVRNAWFEVHGDDMISAQYVATTGEFFARWFSRFHTGSPLNRPIVVTLVPPQEGRRDGFFARYFTAGYTVVTLFWGPETTRETVERAVVQGYLTQLSASQRGAVHVPFWLELAGQGAARVQAVSTHAQTLAAQASTPPRRLEEILDLDRNNPFDPSLAANAYWLLVFLDREARSRAQIERFILRQLGGERPVTALAATYGEQLRSREEAELWWRVGFSEVSRPQGLPVLLAPESRRRLLQWSRITVSTDGRPQHLWPAELWQHRQSPLLRSEIRRRRGEIERESGVIHPFYFNAALSLDRLLHAALGESESAFRAAVTAYEHDLRVGDEIAEDSRAVLDDLAEEIRVLEREARSR